MSEGHFQLNRNRKLERCANALIELVRLKDLKDKLEADNNSGRPYDYKGHADYDTNKPLAWKEARAAAADVMSEVGASKDSGDFWIGGPHKYPPQPGAPS